MKKGIIITCIAALLIGLCLFEYFFLHNTFARMENEILALKAELNIDTEPTTPASTDILMEDLRELPAGSGYNISRPPELTAEAVNIAQRMNDLWQRRKKYAQIMIHNTLLIEYNAILDRLMTNIALGEIPMTVVELNSLYRMNSELRHFNTPYLQNVL